MACLEIDCTLRSAEYAKFYQDIENSKKDYLKVIQLCRLYPEKNEKIMSSALFATGIIFLE